MTAHFIQNIINELASPTVLIYILELLTNGNIMSLMSLLQTSFFHWINKMRGVMLHLAVLQVSVDLSCGGLVEIKYCLLCLMCVYQGLL